MGNLNMRLRRLLCALGYHRHDLTVTRRITEDLAELECPSCGARMIRRSRG